MSASLGCTVLVNGIPDPVPPRPVFLYLDKNGKPVPPPNYVPNLDDCYGGCGCGCGGSGSAAPGTSSGGGCGGNCGGGTPAIGMTACSGDPGAKQLEAVNKLLREASQLISETMTPGFMEFWDGSQGNLLKQCAAPTVDSLAPTPVFTFNCAAFLGQNFGLGWSMIFQQTVAGSTSARSSATVTKGTGTSFTYTNRNAGTGLYTAPPNAVNKLVGNANGTWSETQPDGLVLNYNTSGKLATIQRAGYTWTMSYDFNGRLHTIVDPVARRSTLTYSMVNNALWRFTDVAGRITSFTYTGSNPLLHTIKYPTLDVVTITGQTGTPVTSWVDPIGNRTTYTYSAMGINRLASVTDPTGHLTQISYPPMMGGSQSVYTNANNYTTSYSYTSAGQPRSVQNALAQRITLTWTSGLLTALQDTAGNRTSLSYATMSDGRKFVSSLKTPQGLVYSWLYDSSDHVPATIDPLANRMRFLWDSNSQRRAEIDALGARTSYIYNSGGQLRAVISPVGARTTALFDSISRVRALIDPLKQKRGHHLFD